MPLINSGLGAPVKITLGRAGEQPSVYNARIAGAPIAERTNGQMTQWYPVIVESVTREGVVFLSSRNHNERFTLDRFEKDHSELLDGPKGNPKGIFDLIREAQESSLKFAMSLPASVDTVTLAEVPE